MKSLSSGAFELAEERLGMSLHGLPHITSVHLFPTTDVLEPGSFVNVGLEA